MKPWVLITLSHERTSYFPHELTKSPAGSYDLIKAQPLDIFILAIKFQHEFGQGQSTSRSWHQTLNIQTTSGNFFFKYGKFSIWLHDLDPAGLDLALLPANTSLYPEQNSLESAGYSNQFCLVFAIIQLCLLWELLPEQDTQQIVIGTYWGSLPSSHFK